MSRKIDLTNEYNEVLYQLYQVKTTNEDELIKKLKTLHDEWITIVSPASEYELGENKLNEIYNTIPCLSARALANKGAMLKALKTSMPELSSNLYYPRSISDVIPKEFQSLTDEFLFLISDSTYKEVDELSRVTIEKINHSEYSNVVELLFEHRKEAMKIIPEDVNNDKIARELFLDVPSIPDMDYIRPLMMTAAISALLPENLKIVEKGSPLEKAIKAIVENANLSLILNYITLTIHASMASGLTEYINSVTNECEDGNNNKKC